jgi:hypothetical protein
LKDGSAVVENHGWYYWPDKYKETYENKITEEKALELINTVGIDAEDPDDNDLKDYLTEIGYYEQ